jgi:hypothetical protein
MDIWIHELDEIKTWMKWVYWIKLKLDEMTWYDEVWLDDILW